MKNTEKYMFYSGSFSHHYRINSIRYGKLKLQTIWCRKKSQLKVNILWLNAKNWKCSESFPVWNVSSVAAGISNAI